jgi:N utilization substance protein A
MVMTARILLGWVDPEELEAEAGDEAEGEEGEAAEAGDTSGADAEAGA